MVLALPPRLGRVGLLGHTLALTLLRPPVVGVFLEGQRCRPRPYSFTPDGKPLFVYRGRPESPGSRWVSEGKGGTEPWDGSLDHGAGLDPPRSLDKETEE